MGTRVVSFLESNTCLIERIHVLARSFDEWAYSYDIDRGDPVELLRFDYNEAAVFIEFEQLPNWDSRVFLH